MDNRLRILYCMQPELRGRMSIGRAGNEETGVSGKAEREEKPPQGSLPVMRTEREVGKRPERVPRNAAMALNAPVP